MEASKYNIVGCSSSVRVGSSGRRIGRINEILKLPTVVRMLRRKFTFAFPGHEWIYSGKMINCDRFLMLYEHLGQSLLDAVGASRGGERDRLLSLLDMTDPNKQLSPQCYSIAAEVELYAVAQLYGSVGAFSYSKFARAHTQSKESHIRILDDGDRERLAIREAAEELRKPTNSRHQRLPTQ
jgi:hypothetical protein